MRLEIITPRFSINIFFIRFLFDLLKICNHFHHSIFTRHTQIFYFQCNETFFLVRESSDKLAALGKKLAESESCHADKIEKGLLKNLLIGYIVAPNQNDKLQILKLISSVLNFDQNETDKVGLNKTHSSWLNSLLAGTNTGGSSTENGTVNFIDIFLCHLMTSFIL